MGARNQRNRRRAADVRVARRLERAAAGDAARARRRDAAERFEREREEFFAALPLTAGRVRK